MARVGLLNIYSRRVSNNVLNLINTFDQASSMFYNTPENIVQFHSLIHLAEHRAR